ncbi:hypothetical protein JCM33374_g3150 [Metschnikowia sp. JCM 33374]|nr:hypothetical protein JCM33374_g3150 [Metschnikowia sp. JCM 33374]
MAFSEKDQVLPNGSEDLSRNTARLSISKTDPGNDLKAVRDMFSEAQKGAKKASAVSSSPFDDDNDTAESIASRSSDGSVSTGSSRFPSKRRRSSAHSVALVQEKVHKRKSKWTNEQVSLQYSDIADARLSMNDLRFFVLNVLKSKGPSKTALFEVKAPWKLKNIVFAFVPDLQQNDFNLIDDQKDPKNVQHLRALEKSPESDDTLSFISSHFKYVIPTHMPESMPSPINVFLQFPFTKSGKKKRAAEMSQVKLVLYDLLLTKEQMESNNYPLHSQLDPSPANKLSEGWVETKEFEHEGSHTFALDCEFCQAESGKVLTRISIVNFQNEVVYDQLVKPDEEITDYVTKYSGITEEMLSGETTTLKDVQEKVLSLVSSEDILIGHSLDSDLNVMKIRHPKIIDTSLLFEHHRGYPFKHALKYLAETHLARTIQNGERDGSGHSSVEDSRACLDLVKLKLIEGPDYGKIVGLSLFKSAFDVNPQRQSSLVDYSMDEYGSLLDDVKEPTLVKSVVSNDDEAVDAAIKQLTSKSFHLLWLREVQFNCGRKPAPQNYTGRLIDEANKAGTKKSPVSIEERKDLLRSLDKRLERLYNELPTDSLLIINTGGGDPTRMNYLNYVKRSFQRQLKAGKDIADFSAEELWDFDKATQLQEATETARQGMTLITVKQ